MPSQTLPKHVVSDEIKWVIVPAKLILDSLCLWPERQTRLTHFCNFIGFLCMTNVIIGENVYLYYHSDELTEVATIIAMEGITLQAILTQALLVLQKDKLLKILNTIYYTFWPAGCVNVALLKEMSQKSRLIVIYCWFYTAIMVLCLIQYVAFSMMKFTGNLMFMWTYPGLVWKSPWYEIFHVEESFTCFLISLINCGYDFLFMSFMWNCLCQFKMLGCLFEECFIEPRLSKARTRRYIGYHNKLMETCGEIEEVFTYYFLVYVISTVIGICNATFVLVFDPQEVGKMITYLSVRLCSLLLYCFVGSELIHESTSLSDRIYQSDWHLLRDTNLKKSLLLIMERSQRGEKLTAGGFVVLYLPSFLKIVQLAFSFYTALQNIMQK